MLEATFTRFWTKVIKIISGEISRLEAELKESKKHSQALEAELAGQQQEVVSLSSKLNNAVKANQRLVIHRDNLQQQVAVMEVKVAALTDMWHEIDSLKVRLGASG